MAGMNLSLNRLNCLVAIWCTMAGSAANSLLWQAARKEQKRKDYALQRQHNEKPSAAPGCPGARSNSGLVAGSRQM